MSKYLYCRHATRLRKASLYTGIIGFGGFVCGAVEFALWMRIVTELCRLPSFHQDGIKDQVNLCYVVLVGCLIGLVRVKYFG